MSQLYELPGGGVGHYNDYYEAHMALMMTHLTLRELVRYARLLRAVPVGFYSFESAKVLSILTKEGGPTPSEIKTAIEKIALMERVKCHYGEGRPGTQAKDVTKIFLKIAQRRGFKDTGGFFSS